MMYNMYKSWHLSSDLDDQYMLKYIDLCYQIYLDVYPQNNYFVNVIKIDKNSSLIMGKYFNPPRYRGERFNQSQKKK